MLIYLLHRPIPNIIIAYIKTCAAIDLSGVSLTAIVIVVGVALVGVPVHEVVAK